jgi:hypothetical protein
MDITPHVQSIRARLEAAAGSDQAAVELAARMSEAIDAALQLQLLDLLGQAALELGDHLPSGHVELRLAGRDAQLVFVDDAGGSSSTPAEEDGATARLTLRMSDSLKAAVESVAAREGVSTNAWLVGTVKRALDQKTPRRRSVGNRLTGYAQG